MLSLFKYYSKKWALLPIFFGAIMTEKQHGNRDKLAMALQDAALENLNEDMQALLECVDAFPEKLDEKIQPTLTSILETAQELQLATAENKVIAESELKNLRDDLLVQFGSTINRVITEKFSAYDIMISEKLDASIHELENSAKSVKQNSNIKKTFLIALTGVLLGASLSGAMLVNHYSNVISNKQDAVVSVIKAANVASSKLSASNQSKFTRAFSTALN